MKKFIQYYLIIFTSVIVLSSCEKDGSSMDLVAGLTKAGSGFAVGSGAKVDVYTNSAVISSGYQKFWFALTDSVSGKYIDESHIKLMPMMDMGTMKHSAPFENPASEYAINHLYEGSVFFIMPGMSGAWTLDIQVHNHLNGREGKLALPLTVAEPAKKRMFSFTSAADNTGNYFVSLAEPVKPKVGINDLELVVYKKQSMMAFPADSSLSISFEPEMPTMNHGSPNNINPAHTKSGHYKGKVNFTMTGLWRLHFTLKSGDTIAKTDSLDIEF